MSLINTMLQDLEGRKVSVDTVLQNAQVQLGATVPPVQKSKLKLALFALSGVLGMGAAYYVATHFDINAVLAAQKHQATPLYTQVLQSQVVTTANANEAPVEMASTAMPSEDYRFARTLSISEVSGLLKNLVPALKPAVKKPAQSLSVSAPLDTPNVAPSLEKPLAAKAVPEKNALEKVAAEKTNADKPAFAKQMNAEQESLNIYNQGLSALQSGRVADAQDLFKKAIEINPKNEDARLTWVGLLVDAKHLDEAIVILKSGLQQQPEQIAFAQALARLQIERNQLDYALATLQKSLPYAENDGEFHGFLAAVLQTSERHSEAIAHYQIALKENANQASWWIGLGVSLQALGRASDAKEAYARAQLLPLSQELALFVEQRLKQVQQKIVALGH